MTTRINLGLLSVKGDAMRTANIICLPSHKIWTLRTMKEVKEFLVASFPQIDFSTFVSDEEIARFATSPAGEFPQPQYLKGMQKIFANYSSGMYRNSYINIDFDNDVNIDIFIFVSFDTNDEFKLKGSLHCI